jgi:hypothetical protein
MSNLTQFIKDGQIRDPKQLPIMVVAVSSGYADSDIGYQMVQDTTISAISGASSNQPFRRNVYGWRNNVAYLNVSAGTSYSTLLNITSGGGYLCNVQNIATSDSGGREQGLRITVDGVATTYPALSYDDHSTYTSYGNVFCTYWGYYGLGSANSHINDRTSAESASLRQLPSNDQIPPVYLDSGTDIRIFGAQEFKAKKLPALRFETSCKVELYSESVNSDPYGAYASYYLDSQMM